MTEPNRDSEDLLSLAEIARWLGQSTPSVVTNWRLRYADFPAPSPQSQTEARPRFRRGDVVDWLRSTNRGDLLDGPASEKGVRKAPDVIGEIVERLTAPSTRSIVALGSGSAEWLSAARAVAVAAEVLVVAPNAAESQPVTETIRSEPGDHYFAGRQFELVIARLGVDRTDARRMFDVIERVLPANGTAFVVAPASFLEDPAGREVRERLVRVGLLDVVAPLGVITGPQRGSVGRTVGRQVLLVLRAQRDSDQVLFVDRSAPERVAERLAKVYLDWVASGRRERRDSSMWFTRPASALITPSMMLTIERWQRSAVEMVGAEKTAARLQNDFSDLRRRVRTLPMPSQTQLSARRSTAATSVEGLREQSVLRRVEPVDLPDGASAIELPFHPALVLTADDERTTTRSARRGTPLHTGDLMLRLGRGVAGVAVWRGDGIAFAEQRHIVLRPDERSAWMPEYLAIVLRGLPPRLDAAAIDPADLEVIEVPSLSLAEQRLAAERYILLADATRAAEELASLSARALTRFGEAVARGFLHLDDAEQS